MPKVPAVSPATGKPTSPSYVHTTDFHFVDNAGRTLLMRGVNLSGSSKAPVDRPSYILNGFWEAAESGGESFVGRPLNLDDGSADVHLARLSGWGFNLLRFPVTWEALEREGPGKYDYEFMRYTIRVLHKCREYGFRVYMDPHQDTWSRFSGGSGAPYWTLAACGINPRNFTATQAAIIHCEYPNSSKPEPAQFPAMIWSTNYGRLMSQTLFTLFFAGRDFAPNCIIDGQNIQDYLQSHYIEAIGRLADLIRETSPDLLDDCIIGWDSMNEPFEGLVGWEDLNQNPQSQGSTLKKGTHPTPAQSFRLGMGQAQTVDNFKFGAMGPSRNGTVTIDPKGYKVWGISGQESPDGINSRWGWHRDTTKWTLGTCIWALHGVWDIETGFVNRPEYFHFHPETGVEVHFLTDYWRPHFLAYARRIRRAHPDAILFIQPPVFAQPPTIEEKDLQGRCAYTGHYYDGLTLITRHWNWFNADALGLLRGKYSSTWQAVKIGESAIRKSLQEQLGVLKDDAKILGPYPTVIGEIGVPYDMDSKRSYGWTDGGKYRGDYSRQERALDASLNACDGDNVLNWTAWTYCPDNTHDWGDGWNMEDLSLWSSDDTKQQSDPSFDDDAEVKIISSKGSSSTVNVAEVYPSSETMGLKRRNVPAGWHPNPFVFLTNGARAVRAFSRPWPHKVVGRPKSITFDIKKAYFKLVVTVRPQDKVMHSAMDEDPATEIYIPLVHYAAENWLPAAQGSQSRKKNAFALPKEQSDSTLPDSNVTSETASIMSSFIEHLPAGHKAILEKDLVDIDVTASAGRWSIEGQLLKWWYQVPAEGEQEYVIEVRRQGGAIKVSAVQKSWLEIICPFSCCIM
ncbi:glycoside hydrolase family 5 protein [Amanita muscaria]